MGTKRPLSERMRKAWAEGGPFPGLYYTPAVAWADEVAHLEQESEGRFDLRYTVTTNDGKKVERVASLMVSVEQRGGRDELYVNAVEGYVAVRGEAANTLRVWLEER